MVAPSSRFFRNALQEALHASQRELREAFSTVGQRGQHMERLADWLEAMLQTREGADRINTIAEQGYAPTRISSWHPGPGDRPDTLGFHGTGLPFEQFDMDRVDLGPHAGSARAAGRFWHPGSYGQDRLHALVARKPRRALLMEGDIGDWDDPREWRRRLENNLVEASFERGEKEDLLRFLNDGLRQGMFANSIDERIGVGTFQGQPPRRAMDSKLIRDYLRDQLGIDRIHYRNNVEDPGHFSTVFLNPEDVRSVGARFNPEHLGKSGLFLSLPILAAVRAAMEGRDGRA